MKCCPDGSLPALKEPKDYKIEGETIDIGNNIKCYIVGEDNKKNGKCIVILSDLFGINSGRHKQVADSWAKEGYYVILPDLFENDEFTGDLEKKLSVFGLFNIPTGLIFNLPSFLMFSRRNNGKKKFIRVVNDTIIPFLEKNDITSVGTLGFCYGAYMAPFVSSQKVSDKVKINAHVSCHPSISILQSLIGEFKLEELLEMMNHDVLYMPANEDPKEVKENGKCQQIFEKNNKSLKSITFEKMKHGFMTRSSEVQQEEAREDIKRAFDYAAEFFAERL